MPGNPLLTLQTASLYASNDASTFSGTGGPFGFSPFTAQFGGIVSSAGLAGEPFADTVYGVAPGDIVTFVVAVQNTTAGAAAYGVRLKETMPAGFMVPTDSSGIDLSITDGAGNLLAVSGDLFGAGLVLTNPIPGYDPDSGLNVALITFSLQAAPNLPGLYNSLQVTAAVTADTASPGGPDLSAGVASASTTVVTAAPIPVVTAETDPTAVAKGQTIAFDIALAVPVGTLQDLRIAPLLPAGTAMLDLVSTAVISTGTGLTLGTPQIATDGSIHFGAVTATAPVNNVINVRIVVRADGTVSGPAKLQSVISATDPNSPGGVWSTTVASTVGVVAPPAPPVLTGLSSSFRATPTTTVRPFASLTIADSVPGQSATLAITLQDSTLGRLSAPVGSLDTTGATFIITGTIAAVQSAAQQLVFTPTKTGAERFTLTVEDGNGGIAQDASTLVTTANPGVAAAVGDFNGDGSSDILFQNVDGPVGGWLMNGLSLAGSGVVANPSTAWTPVATGDFNGDGKADILYENQGGTIVTWQMNGLGIANSGIVATPGPAWHAIATGDFDGDGKSDILFQYDDGSIGVWLMNGMAIQASGFVANPGTAWHAVGTGDFNGDGKADILFQHDDGTIDAWEMNGTTILASAIVANPSPNWRAVGTGYFNGDGESGIVLQNKDGTVAIWTISGLSITSGIIVADPGPTWHATVVGDYNGDGKSDILFQNDNGAVAAWLMNGTSIASSSIIANPSAAWQAIGLSGMHFIDGTQSSGVLTGTILADNFVFTSSTQDLHIINKFDPLHDVVTLDQTKFGSYAAVQSAETIVNGSTVIALGVGDTLTINNILPGALAAKNFI